MVNVSIELTAKDKGEVPERRRKMVDWLIK